MNDLLLIDWGLKAGLILAAAWAVNRGLLRRHGSASLKHLVWLAGLAAALAMPILSSVAPPVEIPVGLPVVEPILAAGAVLEPNPGFAPKVANARGLPLLPGPSVLALIWLGGVIFFLLRLGAAYLRLRRIVRNAAPAPVEGLEAAAARFSLKIPVEPRFSRLVQVPLVCGWFRPTLLLPEAAREWSQARLRSIFLHELAHVARRDVPIQIFVELVHALLWLNPLAWLAKRELVRERESACDDLVLAAGEGGPGYAHDLLEVVAQLREPAPASALAMARTSRVERRIRAILDGETPRRRAGRWAIAGVLAAALAIALPVAVMSAETEGKAKKVAGSLEFRVLVEGEPAGGKKARIFFRKGTQKGVVDAQSDPTGLVSAVLLPEGALVWIEIPSGAGGNVGWSTRPFYFAKAEGGDYEFQDEHKQRRTSTKGLEIDLRGSGQADFASAQSFQMRGGGSIRISGGGLIAGGNLGGARITGKGTVQAGTLRWVLR